MPKAIINIPTQLSRKIKKYKLDQNHRTIEQSIIKLLKQQLK